MFTDFLKPVSKELQDFAESCNSFCLGAYVKFNEDYLIDQNQQNTTKIALIGVQEFRSFDKDDPEDTDFDLLRTSLYELKKGNWTLPIYDFGDLIASEQKSETGERLTKILAELIKANYFVILLGGSPSLAYYQYRAYDQLQKNINFFSVDEKLRLGNELLVVNDENYLTKIITSEPLNLIDYSNIGYQTYFVSQEELDLIEQLNFEAVRLGVINQDIKEVEPYTREANAGVINLSSIEANYFKSTKNLTPNGFNSREICGLVKYIGSSYVLSSIYLSNYVEKYNKCDHLLISQMIWYLIEGRNHRFERKNIDDAQYFDKIFVPSDITNFIFYRNTETNQWWLNVSENENEPKIIPCSLSDYEKAVAGEVPLRWWKYFKKFY